MMWLWFELPNFYISIFGKILKSYILACFIVVSQLILKFLLFHFKYSPQQTLHHPYIPPTIPPTTHTHHILNTLRPRQNGRHFPDDIFKCIFLRENVQISIKISLKLVPKGPMNNIPALVQIMAWCQSGNKPLSEPMMVCVTDAYMRHSASMS